MALIEINYLELKSQTELFHESYHALFFLELHLAIFHPKFSTRSTENCELMSDANHRHPLVVVGY